MPTAKKSPARRATPAKKPAGPVKGVALRASNGRAYFIPHHALEAFRIRTAANKAKLDARIAATQTAAKPAPTYEAQHVELEAPLQVITDIIM